MEDTHINKKIKTEEIKTMKVDQLIIPFFSIKEGEIDLLKGINILNESLSFFLQNNNDDIEIVLLENNINTITKLNENCKIHDKRFRIVNSEIEDFIKENENEKINFRYIATEISWRFKMSCTDFSQKIQKLIGTDSIEKVKEQNKSATPNTCYFIDIPKNSKLYSLNKVKKIILINTPNMNPQRPNQVEEDKALIELKNSFNNVFKEFINIVNNNKFLNYFKKPNSIETNTNKKIESKTGNTSWSDGLLLYVRHPEQYKSSIYKSFDKFIVIYDKYPKAKYHLLIIPKENIKNIYHLNKSHIPLIKEMINLSKEIVNELNSKNEKYEFQIGFHAIPSMNQIHMHVISTDFISPYLKTKKHWNSFTSEFFLKPSFIIKQLEENDRVNIDKSHFEIVLKKALICHKCKQELKNMPTLKAHLNTHISN